jgi:hypothetical protein
MRNDPDSDPDSDPESCGIIEPLEPLERFEPFELLNQWILG